MKKKTITALLSYGLVCCLVGCGSATTNMKATDQTTESVLTNDNASKSTEDALSESDSMDFAGNSDINNLTNESETNDMQGELLQDSQNIEGNTSEYGLHIEMDNVEEVICPLKAYDNRIDVEYGTVTHFTYDSTTTGCERGANILLPANYDENKQYPVLYFLHGIFGDEYSMINDGSSRIKQIVANLAADGKIDDIIVVFPNMYASSDPNLKPGFTAEQIAPYDEFINDLTNDLMPYINSHYSVYTDRDHTGLIGFSMGGRESLYIGTRRSDLFANIGCIAPAPGVTPGTDYAMEHKGQLSEDELVIVNDDFPPHMLMICCGTKDSVVGKFPASYHDILTTNQVEHLWYEVPEADHDFNAIKSGLYNYLIRWFCE